MECGETTKKYEKVDSFLKRCLPEARYSGVRLIEPCIVVSNDYNKQFKFVVLANDSLYITENPPKAPKDIREITKVVNITSVELINDIPEFLRGDLKYRTHHILITYKKSSDLTCQGTSQASKTLNVSEDTKLPSATLQKSSPQSSLPLKPNMLQDKDSRNLVNSSATIDKTDCNADQGVLTSERPKKPYHRQLPLLTCSSFESKEGELETNPLSLHRSCSSLDDIKPKNNPKAIRLTTSANAADLRAAKRNMLDEDRLTSHSCSEPNLLSASKERGLLSSFNSLQKQFRERRSLQATKKRFEFSEDFSKELFLGDNNKSREIHLYMLLDDTVMLAYLRSTWDNCLLNAALRQNKKSLSNSFTKNKVNSSKVTVLFDQLEKEIINSKELKNTFILVNELLTASQKDFSVKKLFWQSPDLFVFIVNQVKCYSQQSLSNASQTNRADELEFVLLLLECLTEMFRETELLAARMKVLKTEKCRVVHDLIEITTFCPENKTSKAVEPPAISEAAEVLLTGRHRKKKAVEEKSPVDTELENLSIEIKKCQVALLHDLLITAYQAAWFPSDGNNLNICWMVKILESSKNVYEFIKSIVKLATNLSKVTETAVRSADDATLLFRLFSVIKTILQQSTKLHYHVQEYYTEEFRYYVKLHTLSKCLSKDCPLTPSTLKLVEDVTFMVTESSISSRQTAR